MPTKSTDELINEIKAANSVDSFLDKNSEEMLCTTIAKELNALLTEKKLKRADVIRHSGLDTVYGNQIFSGTRNPKRNKLLAICFGMKLDFAETQTLLKHVGFNLLYAKDKRDSIIIYSLQHKRSVFDCNIDLCDNGFEPLE